MSKVKLNPAEVLKNAYSTDWVSVQNYERAKKTALIVEVVDGTPFIHRLVRGDFEVDGISPQHLARQDYEGGKPHFAPSVADFLASREVGRPYIVLPFRNKVSSPKDVSRLTYQVSAQALREQRVATRKAIEALNALQAPKPQTFDPFDL